MGFRLTKTLNYEDPTCGIFTKASCHLNRGHIYLHHKTPVQYKDAYEELSKGIKCATNSVHMAKSTSTMRDRIRLKNALEQKQDECRVLMLQKKKTLPKYDAEEQKEYKRGLDEGERRGKVRLVKYQRENQRENRQLTWETLVGGTCLVIAAAMGGGR